VRRRFSNDFFGVKISLKKTKHKMQQFQFKIIGGKYVALLALQVWFIPYALLKKQQPC
jgi:hypothetical protein